MAQAVQELYPGVKVTIGPSIEDGFYYDFDYDGTFSPEDLEKIEKKMEEIAGRNLPFVRRELPKQEAIDFSNSTARITRWKSSRKYPPIRFPSISRADFTDLCRGPHVPSTGMHKSLQAHRALPAPTGGAMSATKCCSAFTALLLPTKRH